MTNKLTPSGPGFEASYEVFDNASISKVLNELINEPDTALVVTVSANMYWIFFNGGFTKEVDNDGTINRLTRDGVPASSEAIHVEYEKGNNWEVVKLETVSEVWFNLMVEFEKIKNLHTIRAVTTSDYKYIYLHYKK